MPERRLPLPFRLPCGGEGSVAFVAVDSPFSRKREELFATTNPQPKERFPRSDGAIKAGFPNTCVAVLKLGRWWRCWSSGTFLRRWKVIRWRTPQR
ncbi:MAG: hypothetical protein ACO2PK_04865 [Armatimonadota bacterium]